MTFWELLKKADKIIDKTYAKVDGKLLPIQNKIEEAASSIISTINPKDKNK